MTILSACRFEIQPPKGKTSAQVLAEVGQVVLDWIRTQYAEGTKSAAPAVEFDGGCRVTEQGHRLVADHRECESHQWRHLSWHGPYLQASITKRLLSRNQPPQIVPQKESDQEIDFRLQCDVACDLNLVQVALTLRARLREYRLFTMQLELLNVKFARDFAKLRTLLLSGWACSIDGRSVPCSPNLLTAEEVGPFVSTFLMDAYRVLPIVMVGPGDRLLSRLSARAATELLNGIQQDLLGLAQVAGLYNARAAERLTELLGPDKSCNIEGMRVYWPDYKEDAPGNFYPMHKSTQHPLSLVQVIHDGLSKLSASRFDDGSLIRDAKDAIREADGERRRIAKVRERDLAAADAAILQARQQTDAARQDLGAARDEARQFSGELTAAKHELDALREAVREIPAERDQQLQEFAAGLEQAWGECRQLRADLDRSRRRIDELESEQRYAREAALEQLKAAPAGSPSPSGERSFASVAAALRAAQADFSDVLSIWDDAWQSADESPFAVPDQVWRALEAIAEVGRSYFIARNSRTSLGPIEQAFRNRVPFKYTGFESDSTMGEFGAQRVFHQDHDSRQMQRHLTLGGGQTNNCLQIYFEFDDDAERVLIGYCGKHLPYHGQRT